MLKKVRKSSSRVTLVLIGLAGLAGCGGPNRDVYATREDCLADWGNKPEDCTPATDSRHAGRGYFYGPAHSYSYRSPGSGGSWGRSGSSSSSHSSSPGSRSSGSSGSSSRGGFGSSGHSSSG
jgi:hypothetical protein